MPRGFGIVWLLIVLSGCVGTETAPAPTPWQAYKVTTDPGPDRVLLDVGLVQSPLEDPFLDRELWNAADEMLGSATERELRELNGYRVGILVGSAPEPLRNLLGSPRSCVEHRGRSAPS